MKTCALWLALLLVVGPLPFITVTEALSKSAVGTRVWGNEAAARPSSSRSSRSYTVRGQMALITVVAQPAGKPSSDRKPTIYWQSESK